MRTDAGSLERSCSDPLYQSDFVGLTWTPCLRLRAEIFTQTADNILLPLLYFASMPSSSPTLHVASGILQQFWRHLPALCAECLPVLVLVEAYVPVVVCATRTTLIEELPNWWFTYRVRFLSDYMSCLLKNLLCMLLNCCMGRLYEK